MPRARTSPRPRLVLAHFALLAPLAACSGGSGETADDATATDTAGAEPLTYWRDIQPIVAERCVTCHVDGGIAPFALDTHAAVSSFAPVLAQAIEAGEMPPWPPDESCREYTHSLALSLEEEEALLTYFAGEMPEGDPADAPAPDAGDPPRALVPDVVLEMPEAYTAPNAVADDYRCFLIPWPAEIDEPRFVTGLEVVPGETRVVHHVIVYAVAEAGLAAYVDRDDADPGPGYTCFGGPGPTDGSARWIGAWVPGMATFFAPDGVGQQIDPGTTLVMQVHYHPIGQDLADRSSIALETAASVTRRAEVAPIADFNWVVGGAMEIPAGDPDVTHEVVVTHDDPFLSQIIVSRLGLAADAELEVINAGMHMHLFGKRGRIELRDPAAGASTCLVDIPRWDFNWQSNYEFAEPVRFQAGQELSVQCWWDNSADNQPIVDGVKLDPVDRNWGDGTLDEMCLGILYVTSAPG